MNRLAYTLLFLSLACVPACGGGNKQIQDLPLVWTGAKSPAASTAVDKAFEAGPIEVGEFKDGRTGDKSVVGTFRDDGFKVKTQGDVRAFWAGRLRIMLEDAGAKLGAPANARFDAELLEFDCIEDNTFNATVRMKVTVTRHDGSQPWSKTYEGKGKRWGRTHNPDNFTEAFTSALQEATRKLVQDADFAKALTGEPQVKAAGLPIQ